MDENKEIETLEKTISDKDNDQHLEEIKTKMDTKLTDFEEKLNTMHKCLVEKDEHIVKLQDKVKQLESNQENVEKLQIYDGKSIKS